MEIVIKVEEVSKQYRLGKVGTGTLSHDLNRWWHRIRGKEDPYLKIGETNDRNTKGNSEYVWALQDISFDVGQGEVVGIIGRNGAGKSTLLKILSRTTGPTTGNVKLRGRVASLLEVGTGFHPELTGRENIYLNGAILGMTKREIAKKFDEIVDFSGVERYIDTPVKRYSSGMYVRLAFAVAAHLESEILIVDEVLAVGDAEFQKKCLGKMGDVSKGEGRTVLFVSHNMQSIANLCGKGILMEYGSISMIGQTHDVIRKYLIQDEMDKKIKITAENLDIAEVNFISGQLRQVANNEIVFELVINAPEKYDDCRLGLYFRDEYENVIASYITPDVENFRFGIESDGTSKITLTLKDVNLVDGAYFYSFWLKSRSKGVLIRSKPQSYQVFEKILDRAWPKDGGKFYLNGFVTTSSICNP